MNTKLLAACELAVTIINEYCGGNREFLDGRKAIEAAIEAAKDNHDRT